MARAKAYLRTQRCPDPSFALDHKLFTAHKASGHLPNICLTTSHIQLMPNKCLTAYSQKKSNKTGLLDTSVAVLELLA